ncbi:tetratricopeptide repeat protein [Chryseobacterium nematophagum]|uniref:Tetratricopeptide repeat protein n=1 Tax=Chryseobacterium nematophagum TaxID=2305228 RepID=A0A3M7L804_9FLAO|nr:tetratricopeptide repeat protein [Chryseobacterium nematophagum]
MFVSKFFSFKKVFNIYFSSKVMCLFCLLFIIEHNGQTYTLSELEGIMKNYKSKGEYEEAIKFNLDVLKEYKKDSYSHGIITTNIYIGNLLASVNEYGKSLSYLNEAKKEMTKTEDPVLYSKLYNEYGRDYFLLKLYKQSNEKLNIAIAYANKIPDNNQREHLLTDNYLWKWSNFDQLDKVDSLYVMQSRLLKLEPRPLVYIKIAERYIKEKKNLDSAEYYLKKSIELNASKKYALDNDALVLMNLGKLHMIKGEYAESLDYYFKSLSISQKIKNQEYEKETYSELSKVYNVLNNKEKSEEYYKKYSFLNDSTNDREKRALYTIVNELGMKEKDNHVYLFFVTMVVIFALTGYVTYVIHKRKNKFGFSENSLDSIEEIKDKIHEYESFSEIIKMAEEGNPFFLTSFKKLYPDFHEKLKSHCSGLTEHDIKFCIYLRLNLNAKQILQYENITLRAIETKKYRLKKKLELSSDVKLSSWILEL